MQQWIGDDNFAAKDSSAKVVAEGLGLGEGGKLEEEKFEYLEELDFAFDCFSSIIIERFKAGDAWYSIRETIQKSVQVGSMFKPFCANLAVGICGSPLEAKKVLESGEKNETKDF